MLFTFEKKVVFMLSPESTTVHNYINKNIYDKNIIGLPSPDIGEYEQSPYLHNLYINMLFF